MRILLSSLFLTLSLFAHASEAQQLINAVNKKMKSISDYKASVQMHFDLPGIKINDMKAKVFFKRPDKFRIKAKGIFFMPKDNPLKNVSALLENTKAYTSVISGYESVGGKRCAIVNIIPLNTELELIVGKFWISLNDPLIYKTEITTKKNGTIRSRNIFKSGSSSPLPQKVIIQIEMTKFKVPKLLAADIKKKSSKKEGPERGTGKIFMTFTDYQINTKLNNSHFQN